MEVKEACKIIYENAQCHDYGKFFGEEPTELPIGVGQIYEGFRYPILSKEDQLYDTALGNGYIFTHECDIDQGNDRSYNDLLLICPVIPFENLIHSLAQELNENQLKGFIDRLARNEISRVIYIPPFNKNSEYGGILYLNQITHTHVGVFSNENCKKAATVTSYGLRIIDYKIANHLLRPKTFSLPLMTS